MANRHKRKTKWKWCWSLFKGWKEMRQHKKMKREHKYEAG